MAAVVTEDIRAVSPARRTGRTAAQWIAHEDAIELGIWLSGLRSFLRTGSNGFFTGDTGDRSREARVLHSSLLRTAMLAALTSDPQASTVEQQAAIEPLSRTLRNTILIGDELVANAVSAHAYDAWCEALADRLDAVPVAADLISAADEVGSRHLPAVLLAVVDDPEPTPDNAELALVLPLFGRVLRYLRVVGGMLERDEPLKPAILIFSRVNEMIFDLTAFINGRLERFHDTEAEMFASLDAASYTASMELKKVYAQELAGVSGVRPAPSVYARMETAYALLNDGFQLILAGFAKTVDPKADIFRVFPEFQTKREQSIVLKQELDALIRVIQSAEAEPQEPKLNAMDTAIDKFMQGSVNYLFYKDIETVERFVEEITMTRGQDLVPLLHRFGAYLDTLLGQVSLRSVLADEPFAH